MQFQIVGERQEFDAFERKNCAGILSRLSIRMMAVLREHADGPQAIRTGTLDNQTAMALRGRGLIMFDDPVRHFKTHRYTTATPLGRKVIALMLAQDAEILMGPDEI